MESWCFELVIHENGGRRALEGWIILTVRRRLIGVQLTGSSMGAGGLIAGVEKTKLSTKPGERKRKPVICVI